MKNSILFLMACVWSAGAMDRMNQPWSKENVAKLRESIKECIKFGMKHYDETNGVLGVYKSMGTSLEKQEPHQLGEHVTLAQSLLGDCQMNKNYQYAFETAVFLQKESITQKTPESAWVVFRAAASHVLAGCLEAQSSLRMNRSPAQMSALFENNKNITVDSKEGKHFFAGTLVLLFLKELQERKIKEMADAKAKA